MRLGYRGGKAGQAVVAEGCDQLFRDAAQFPVGEAKSDFGQEAEGVEALLRALVGCDPLPGPRAGPRHQFGYAGIG